MSDPDSRVAELGGCLASSKLANSILRERLNWQQHYIDFLNKRVKYLEGQLCTCKRVRFSKKVQIFH